MGDGEIMNKFVKGLSAALMVGACALAFTTSAQAAPVPFGDGYIGGDPTNSNWDGADVIGADSKYNTTGAEVERSGDNLRVKILTNYADNVGSDGTSLGALFIGDDIPAITSILEGNTTTDTFVGDESRFQYALDFNTRPASSDGSTLASGDATLFGLIATDGNATDVETSFAGGIYRDDQAVRPIPVANPDPNDDTPLNAVGTGSWELSGAGKYVEFVINDFFKTGGPIDSDTQNGFVFAWAMSCANDVIFEWVKPGSLNIEPVPLPAGFILLLSGLLGVGWLGRSRAKQA